MGGGPAAQCLLGLGVLGLFGGGLFLFGFDPDDTATASGLWMRLAMRRS